MRQSILIISFTLFLGCSLKKGKEPENDTILNNNKIIAYVTGWEENWGDNLEKVKQITHINYAFANIKNGQVVLGSESDPEDLKKLNTLKQVNPALKILISIGGWSWSKNFSDAVLTESSREIFANSAISYMQKYKLDGVDLDWEYPGLPGDGNVFRPEDKENFTTILKLIREKLDSLSTDNHYLLTIATGASQNYLDHTNIREAQKYLDFINIMTYDFHGGSERKTGHHANLTASKYDSNDRVRNATTSVQQHIDAGIPVNKIVLGVPFYGRWWKGTYPENNGLYQPTFGVTGAYTYKSIIDSLNSSDTGFKSYWDSTAQVPYIWRQSDSLFISYDDTKSIKLKADFVKENQMGGIMFWQFDGDNGELLKTISDNLLLNNK